ncbi:hypothetical protein C8F04DRAFT_971733 [Mycena alexandri]|uniref:Uncharacterized protein n=1 Tax=Mycena alexandri TaxID=1745969 RepID=A0AAD6S7G0_9AGAR|nr:hypothetical protein C8F04DRAFT_971733 [Mycena alexandri]
MAPSLESSSRGVLPVEQSSPVKYISALIEDYVHYQHIQAAPGILSPSPPSTPRPAGSSSAPLFVRSAVDGLSRSSASFLTSSSPVQSRAVPPAFKPYTISPLKATSRYSPLLDRPVHSAREQELVDALREADHRDNERKRQMMAMQASAILSGIHSNRVQSQLQAAEERKKKKEGNGRRKMGDGKPKYFTGEAFYNLSLEDDRERVEQAAEKEQRQEQRTAHARNLVEWKKANEAIRERNEVRRATFVLDTAAWEEEKAAAKVDKRKPGWAKPKVRDYGIENLLPRPKKPVGGGNSDVDEEEGSANGSNLGDE